MFHKEQQVQDLYDARGVFLGLWISPELWNLVSAKVTPILEEAIRNQEQAAKDCRSQEPLADWELLVQHWDFKYPVDKDVYCQTCNNKTDDWQKDEPRKFVLKAANLGGLVSFQCQQCQARISKKHFKDKIQVETEPAK